MMRGPMVAVAALSFVPPTPIGSTTSRGQAEEVASLGPEARVCALPDGPQTIPYVEDTDR